MSSSDALTGVPRSGARSAAFGGATDAAGGAPAQRWASVMQDNYGTPPVTLVAGAGAWVTDDTGRRYLDLVGGIAVNALGHAHPAVVAAVREQVATLGHTSNLAINLPALHLSERLSELLRAGGRTARVFLCNSGAEANEAAFKLARLTGRTRMVAATGGFHGRTMGALALTGQPAKADPFRPLPGDIAFVPFGDAGALAAAVDGQTAAVVLEPIQGEGGVVVPPTGYLAAARRITRDAGALLILDEVQTGIGRTGHWFAHRDPAAGDVSPDVVTLAKGLGGGLPIGAMVALGDSVPAFVPGSHGCTFGGNPVCAAAGLAVLDTIESEGLLGNAADRGAQLRDGLAGIPGVDSVRGAGLLIGAVLSAPVARAVEVAARDGGVLVNAVAPGVIRLAPPLILTVAEADHGLDVLRRVISGTRRSPGMDS
ncbi:MAG: acetylornithine transaminase [Candidatus Nanopelagicales bacterium]